MFLFVQCTNTKVEFLYYETFCFLICLIVFIHQLFDSLDLKEIRNVKLAFDSRMLTPLKF